MTSKKVDGAAIKVIQPYILLGKVFGVNKFNFKEQRISHVSLISILLSLVVLIAMIYIIREDIKENFNLKFYGYISYFLGVWSPLQYILISALTFFLRIESSKNLFSKFELIYSAFGGKFNMAAQRRQNGGAVVLIVGHFVIKMTVAAVAYGCWTALLFSHYTLTQMLEEAELCCFFALVRVLRCELQRLRSEVKSWYAREAFISTTTGDKSINDFIEVHGNIMESYNILTELYSSQFLLSLCASLVCCLIIVQIFIDDFLKGEAPSVVQALGQVYWFLRCVMRLFLISTGCSWFQVEANNFKKALVDILVNGRYETRGEVAALLSVVHIADRSNSTVYRLFALNNALPFQFLSLLATYTIILIQFANM